jgi:hypothetical protein
MVDVSQYLAKITSEHASKPKFMAAVAASLQPLVDAQNVALSLQTLFDLDTAVGDQLDKTGELIGLTRYITEPLAQNWFSWGTAGAGWGQADWYLVQPFVRPPTQVVRLDDVHYRILLKARVAANVWDGTIPGAYRAWEIAFAPEGFQILIQNVEPKRVPWFTWGDASAGWGEAAWYNGIQAIVSDNMHIILALVGPPLDALTKALFTGGYLGMKAAGVKVDFYAVQTIPGKPMFAWGVGPTPPNQTGPTDYTCPPVNLGGWGVGAWADMTVTGS